MTDTAALFYGFNQIVILQLTTLGLLFSLTPAPTAVQTPVQTPVVQSAPATTEMPIQKRYEDVKSQDYGPISDPQNVKKFVTDYFSDIPLMAKIAGCESHNRQVNSSGNVQRGEKNHYDVGVMQINELYHGDEAKKLGYDLYSADGNVAFARHLYEEQGSKPWASSQACWGRFADTQTGSASNS